MHGTEDHLKLIAVIMVIIGGSMSGMQFYISGQLETINHNADRKNDDQDKALEDVKQELVRRQGYIDSLAETVANVKELAAIVKQNSEDIKEIKQIMRSLP